MFFRRSLSYILFAFFLMAFITEISHAYIVYSDDFSFRSKLSNNWPESWRYNGVGQHD